MAALLPCMVSLLLVPLLVYWLVRPEIKHTPDALNPPVRNWRKWAACHAVSG